jgi:hypothetical protein
MDMQRERTEFSDFIRTITNGDFDITREFFQQVKKHIFSLTRYDFINRKQAFITMVEKRIPAPEKWRDRYPQPPFIRATIHYVRLSVDYAGSNEDRKSHQLEIIFETIDGNRYRLIELNTI